MRDTNNKKFVHVRTAFYLPSLAGGGAERSTIATAMNWPVKNDSFIFVGKDAGPYRRDLPADSYFTVGPTRTVRLPIFYTRVRKFLKENAIEALVAYDRAGRLLVFGRMIKIIPPVAIVLVTRNTLSGQLNEWYRLRMVRIGVKKIIRWLYKKADAIVGVSVGVSRDLEITLNLDPGSVTTIYNPVDTFQIQNRINEAVSDGVKGAFSLLKRPIIITAGRLVQQKAHADLIKAFHLLPDSQQGSLAILGEGVLRKDLELLIQRLGLTDQVWMPGFIDNPWWFMAHSDLFVLSSQREGFARVLVEAMACGLPVVSTDCPHGPREILTSALQSRLTPVGDPAALSIGISQVLSQEAVELDYDFTRFEPHVVAHQYHRLIHSAARGDVF